MAQAGLKASLELLIFLPSPPNARIAGVQHSTHLLSWDFKVRLPHIAALPNPLLAKPAWLRATMVLELAGKFPSSNHRMISTDLGARQFAWIPGSPIVTKKQAWVPEVSSFWLQTWRLQYVPPSWEKSMFWRAWWSILSSKRPLGKLDY